MRTWISACVLSLLAVTPLSALELSGFVYDLDGKPVVGARVVAYRPEPSAERLARLRSKSPQRSPLAVSRTDEQGRFAIGDLPSGVVEVQAEEAGFAPASQLFIPGDGALTFTMARAAEVEGKVVAAGKPVSNAAVTWFRGDEFGITTITDADGRYTVPDPRVWATKVAVFHPSFAPRYSLNERMSARIEVLTLDTGTTLRGTVLDPASQPVADAVIRVDGLDLGRSDAEGKFDVARVPKRFHRLSATSGGMAGVGEVGADGSYAVRMSAAKAIEGAVRLRDGASSQPLATAPLLIRDINGEAEATIVVADEKGRFTLEGLTAGRYGIHLPPGLESRVRADYSERMSLEDLGPNYVDLRNGNRVRHDVDLFRPSIVLGRVMDRNGKPVAGAAVVLVAAETPNVELGLNPDGPRTASDGSFRIPVLWIDGPQTLEVRVVRTGHSNARSEPFSVANGGREFRADVILPEETEVRVRVVDERGKPIAGARAMFGPVDRTVDYRSTPERLLHAGQQSALITSANGEVLLGLAPGEYDFAATAEDYQARTRSGETIGRSAATVTITLPRAVAITGRVLRNGQGVPQVNVHVTNSMRDVPLMTDQNGAFRVSGLAPGDYEVLFMKHDEMIEERRSIAAPAQGITIELPPAGSIAGAVVDRETGQLIRQFGIEVQRMDAGPVRRPLHQMMRGGDGRFEFPAVPAGEIQIVAVADGYLPSDPTTVQVAAGAAKSDLRITLDRGATITGRVTDDRGRVVTDVRVGVAPADPNAVESTIRMRMGPAAAMTDAEGEFSITGVRPGTAVVTAARPGFLTARTEVSVDRTARVELRLERGLTISGVVRHGGRGVEGAQVGANTAAAGADYQTATTDASGRFTLQGLLPAIYTISAFKEGLHHREVKGIDPESERELVIDLDDRDRAVITGRVIGMPQSTAAEKVSFGRVTAMGGDHGAEARIDGSGTFRIEDAPAGVVRIVAQIETSRGSRTTAQKVVEVSAGSEISVDLEFEAAVIVSGRITRAGAPAKSATIVFTRSSGPAGSAVADESGSYSVPLPEAGTYRVFVHAGEMESGRYESIHTFTDSRTLNVDLREVEIRGTVVDAATGAPVPEAIVSIFPERSPGGGSVPPPTMETTSARMLFTETMTDRSGRFAVKVSAPGPWEIVASARGYAQTSRTIAAGGPVADQRLDLARAEALTVRVIEARRGTPLEAHLIVRDEAERIVASRPERRADGVVAYALKPGRYTVTAVAHGYAQRSVQATAPGSVEIAVGAGGDVLLESPRHLEGKVVVRDSQGVVALPCCEGSDWALAGTRTLIQQLMPGTYAAELIDLRGNTIATVSFVVRANETTRVPVR